MNQPVPKISAADIERLLARDFPDVAAARTALASYGSKDWHREPERVRAAALKLAGGSIEKLQRTMAMADNDYRDVLAYAEYPSYMDKISATEKDAAKRQKLIEEDWKQYRDWFEKT